MLSEYWAELPKKGRYIGSTWISRTLQSYGILVLNYVEGLASVQERARHPDHTDGRSRTNRGHLIRHCRDVVGFLARQQRRDRWRLMREIAFARRDFHFHYGHGVAELCGSAQGNWEAKGNAWFHKALIQDETI